MSAQQTFGSVRSVRSFGESAGPARRPPSAAKPLRWAADAVAVMREGARVRLDYSAQSLWRVDRMIEEIRQEGAPYAAVQGVLRGFGAYGGEVVVRWAGGEWVEEAGGHWVRTWDGSYWDPFEEARRCYEGEGSLRLLCRDAMRCV
ncbi:hypothetical protein [Streptomyces neyagawaensis]|uniref:hypothetical protein n=1 Tax=Streptomyces neyagawaensis TaxID=42238 RepID=UPI00201CEA4D|nr:hypothetical protein [Streptomyces neyagawaensis]MCL6734140.1 hypothetical protein [Streptomyces neyagawaensis]MDE1681074.1 hypothetical protein [Streptomyces neyagawaensis]